MAIEPLNMDWPAKNTYKRELPNEVENALEIALIIGEIEKIDRKDNGRTR